MFEYPLTLKFETKDEHTKHVLDYQSFYTTILNRCVNDTNEVYLLESQLEVAKKEAEEAKKNDEESKKKVKESKRKEEIARKEAEEAKKKDEESRKQAEESKRKEEIARKEAEEAKKNDEESKKKAEESKRKEELARKEAEEAKKNDEESKKKAEESKRKEDIARKEAEEAKKNDEESRKKAEESKRKEELARKEADEAKKNDKESRKKAEESNRKEEETRKKIKITEKENKALEEKVKHADLLIGKKRKYDSIESSAKGKTFESKIAYTLNSHEKLLDMPCTVEDSDTTKACDIRLIVKDLGVVGIEAKNKLTINKNDIEKFKRDILTNNFEASIFWSKTAAIPYLSVGNQSEDFFHIEEKVLYIRSKDFQQSVEIIYVFLLGLKTSRAIPGDNRQFKDFIIKMFDMLRRHYSHFQKLKKEVQNLDSIMLNDIENIESMCQRELYFKLKPVDKKGHLYLACESYTDLKKLKCYENKTLQNKKSLPVNGIKNEASQLQEGGAIDDDSSCIKNEAIDNRNQSDHRVTSDDQKKSGKPFDFQTWKLN